MRHIITTVTLLLTLTACPLPEYGATWGPCDPYEQDCDETSDVCHGGSTGNRILAVCTPENESLHPSTCEEVHIGKYQYQSTGVSYCRIPCETDLDCAYEYDFRCSDTGWCAWEVM